MQNDDYRVHGDLTLRLPCEVGAEVFVVLANTVLKGNIDRFIIGDALIPVADICLPNGGWLTACTPEEYHLTAEEAEKELVALRKKRKMKYSK